MNIESMWDFRDPMASEARFRAALGNAASPDEAFILNTQIARTLGLRGDFAGSRTHLAALEPQLPAAGPEARTRYWLELGRSYASAAHRPETQDVAKARNAYGQALAIAREAKLDGLAVDTIHMFAFVDRAPADRLRWGKEALAVALASTQPQARAWESSIRNNIGVAQRDLGEHTLALGEFQRALELRESMNDAYRLHVAKWMVARSLRELKRSDEALAMQKAMEAERQQANAPDAYVFDELALLYAGRGDATKAESYLDQAKALRSKSN